MRYFLLVLLLASPFPALSQDSTSVEELVQDFNYFVELLEQTHPDPYQPFGGRVEFQRSVQELRDRIQDAATPEEFRRLTTAFVSGLRDGHTGLRNSAGGVGGERARLGVDFKIAADGLFIGRVSGAERDLFGHRLVAVDGLPVDSLLQRAGLIQPSENRYGRYSNLRRLLTDGRTVGRLLTGVGQDVTLTLEAPDGDTVVRSVPYQAEVEYEPTPSTSGIERPNGLMYWQMLADGEVGYFAWNGMVSREVVEQVRRDAPRWTKNNLDWVYGYLPGVSRPDDMDEAIRRVPSLYQEFHALLTEMRARGSEHLIIDLRRNSGGMTPLIRPLLYMMYGDEYLLADFPAEYNRRLSPLYLKKAGFESIEALNEDWNTDYVLGDFQFGTLLGDGEPGTLEERRRLENITYAGFGREYVESLDGKAYHTPRIVVLTSSSTFSAAYHFMYFLWRLGGTDVVGVPPRQAGNAFMEATQFSLPNTGLRGSISNAVQILFPDDPERGRVFMPDFPMNWSDFRRYGFDSDAEVLYTLDLIDGGKL